jgi:hypothetical protein
MYFVQAFSMRHTEAFVELLLEFYSQEGKEHQERISTFKLRITADPKNRKHLAAKLTELVARKASPQS